LNFVAATGCALSRRSPLYGRSIRMRQGMHADLKTDETSQTLAKLFRVAEVVGKWREPVLNAFGQGSYIIARHLQFILLEIAVRHVADEQECDCHGKHFRFGRKVGTRRIGEERGCG